MKPLLLRLSIPLAAIIVALLLAIANFTCSILDLNQKMSQFGLNTLYLRHHIEIGRISNFRVFLGSSQGKTTYLTSSFSKST